MRKLVDEDDTADTITYRCPDCSKCLVYNGIEPGEKASPDGVHVKLFGYKCDSRNDILYPGFAELNLNKKVRGAKKSNILSVLTLEDAGRLLNSVTLT